MVLPALAGLLLLLDHQPIFDSQTPSHLGQVKGLQQWKPCLALWCNKRWESFGACLCLKAACCYVGKTYSGSARHEEEKTNLVWMQMRTKEEKGHNSKKKKKKRKWPPKSSGGGKQPDRLHGKWGVAVLWKPVGTAQTLLGVSLLDKKLTIKVKNWTKVNCHEDIRCCFQCWFQK